MSDQTPSDPTRVGTASDGSSLTAQDIVGRDKITITVGSDRQAEQLDAELDYLHQVRATCSSAPAVLADSLPNARQIDLTTQYLPLRATAEVAFDISGGSVVGCQIRDKSQVELHRPAPAAWTALTPGPDVLGWLADVLGPTSAIGHDVATDEGHYLFRDLDVESAIGLSQRCVVVGSPGSGKSTVLRHLAMRSAAQLLAYGDSADAASTIPGIKLWKEQPKLPIFISLPHLVRQCLPSDNTDPPGSILLRYLHATVFEGFIDGAGNDWVRRRLREGSVLLLLDGLDEIPNAASPARRHQMQRLVEIIGKQYPGIQLVVTARTYAYAGDWELPDFDVVGIDDLDGSQLRGLVAALSTGVFEPDQQQSFEQSIFDLPEDIRTTPFLVMLYWVVWLHRMDTGHTGALPATRTALYSACIDAVVESSERREIDGVPSLRSLGISQDNFRMLLEELAFRLQVDETPSTTSAPHGAPLFDSGLVMTAARVRGISGIDYDGLLELLAARVGFLREQAPERFQFVHRSFQEYLAARRLCTDQDFPAVAVRTIPLLPQQWLQVMEYVLEVASGTPLRLSKLVDGLLAQTEQGDELAPDDPAWWLVLYAGLAFQAGGGPAATSDPALIERLEQRCVTLVGTAALPARERTKVGDVLAEIGDPRPGVLVRADGLPDISFGPVPLSADGSPVGDAFEIGRYPVTNAQFRAFTSADDGYNDPQWWDGLPHARDGWADSEWDLPNRPRERVSWYEAVAFCRWLSARTGRSIRLPTTTEWRLAALGDGPAQDYPYGPAYSSELANTARAHVGQTSAVGIFPGGQSVNGIDDLSGNVWDWCLRPVDLDTQSNAPLGPSAPVRGGSRSSTPEDARATVEHCTRNRAGRHSDLGFRVVRVDTALRLAPAEPVGAPTSSAVRTSSEFTTSRSTMSEVVCSTPGRAIRVARFGPSTILVGTSLGEILAVPLDAGLVHVPDAIPPMQGAVRALSATQPGRVLAGFEDGSIRVIWPYVQTMATVGRHTGPVYGLLELDDEVIAVGRDGVVRRWAVPFEGRSYDVEPAVEDSVPLAEHDVQLGTIYCIDASAGRLLVGTDAGKLARIDLERGEVSPIGTFNGAVLSVTCLPGGECAAVSADGLSLVTDPGLEVTTMFEAHEDMVRTVAFGDGPSVVFTGSKDGTVRATDLARDRRVVFNGHGDYVYDCLHLPEVGALISASGDGTVRRWPLDLITG